MRQNFQNPGIVAAFAAALLFGAGTPLSKLLLGQINPWMLAALLYLGSGMGLLVLRLLRRRARVQLAAGEWRWLAGAILAGGVAAPILLMWGLTRMPASGASLLLNAEGVFTAVIAWLVFKEHADKRILLGMAAMVAGAVLLSWPQNGAIAFAGSWADAWSGVWPALAIVLACLCWGIDNNFTRKVALNDASWIALVKGLGAGSTNLVLACLLGAKLPPLPTVLWAGAVGFMSYGASLVLFVVALRHLGTARTGAYFSVAPFFGAVLSLALLKEPFTLLLAAGGALMALGTLLHLSEDHGHAHVHAAQANAHEHPHHESDPHHQHSHAAEDAVHQSEHAFGRPHSHWHQHPPLQHEHPHYPDVHHQHRH